MLRSCSPVITKRTTRSHSRYCSRLTTTFPQRTAWRRRTCDLLPSNNVKSNRRSQYRASTTPITPNHQSSNPATTNATARPPVSPPKFPPLTSTQNPKTLPSGNNWAQSSTSTLQTTNNQSKIPTTWLKSSKKRSQSSRSSDFYMRNWNMRGSRLMRGWKT